MDDFDLIKKYTEQLARQEIQKLEQEAHIFVSMGFLPSELIIASDYHGNRWITIAKETGV